MYVFHLNRPNLSRPNSVGIDLDVWYEPSKLETTLVNSKNTWHTYNKYSYLSQIIKYATNYHRQTEKRQSITFGTLY